MNTAVERLEEAIEKLQNGKSPLPTFKPEEGSDAEEWAMLMAAARFAALRHGADEPDEAFTAGLRRRVLAEAPVV
jgi:hypothetical protein